MSIPTFLGISNHLKCIKFWLEHDERHKFRYGDKKFYRLSKYAYFLVFFIQISIIRVLSHTDAWDVNLYKSKLGMLMNIWNPRWPPRELSMQYNQTLQGYTYSFSFHKLFLCNTYTYYDSISHTQLTWFKKRKLVFQHNLKSKMATNMVGAI